MRRTIAVTLALASLAIVSGCESDASDDMRKKQDAALKDPFSYGPDADQMINATPTSPDRSDITGGGIGHYDHDAMKRDLKSVFDP
jgi:hypothetical protein